jgi:hypothetical protein
MLSRKRLDAFKSAVSAVSADAASALRNALAASGEPFGTVQELVLALVNAYGDQAAYVAAEFYDALAAEAAAQVPGADMAQQLTQADIDRSLEHNGMPEAIDVEAAALLGRIVDRLVQNQARRTIADNAVRDRAMFARVPTGATTCAFCMLLASRGFVYATRSSAGELGQYHFACDCQIVPSFEQSPAVEGYDPDSYYQQYLSARDAAASGDIGDILHEWRKTGVK